LNLAKDTAPVIFLNFNRPDKTKQTLAAIRLRKPSQIFVFADGPRADNPEDSPKCNAVRTILTTGIDWPCTVFRFFPEENLGCGRGPASAITLAFEYYGEAIILEDDFQPEHGLFAFCTKMLELYRHDATVGAVNGFNLQDGLRWGTESHYFSNYFHRGGWATWKRSWTGYDPQLKTWPTFRAERWSEVCMSELESKYWDRVYSSQSNSAVFDTWDCQFTFLLKEKSQKLVTPNYPLLENFEPTIDAMHSEGAHQTLSRLNQHTSALELHSKNGICYLADQYTFWKAVGADDTKGTKPVVLKKLRELSDAVLSRSKDAILQTCADLKSITQLPGVDLERGYCFWAKGKIPDAVQAFREELRWFPGNTECKSALERIGMPTRVAAIGDSEFQELYGIVQPYTMLGAERLHSLYSLAKQICNSPLEGDFVECGVAAGGSTLLLALVIKRHSRVARKLWSFDTFEGMPPPTALDRSITGLSAQGTNWGAGTCSSPLAYVADHLSRYGVAELVELQKGLFRDTLPGLKENEIQISLLHMDGDWFESTSDILTHAYDQVLPGGFIQIDDYGHWTGCRKAVDEFFENNGISVDLKTIDYTGRFFQKKTKRENPIEERLPYANIGCGDTYDHRWINFDLNAVPGKVQYYNFDRKLPIEDESLEAIYSSHFLEHLTKGQAKSFVNDCYRALSPGGIIRLVTPDLERAAQEYLTQLDSALNGHPNADARYDWITLELLDQLVRHAPGGEMLKYLSRKPVPEAQYIKDRVGNWIDDVRPLNHPTEQPPDPGMVGAFRLSGEAHQWMYDRFSLKRLLSDAGFVDFRVVDFKSSNVRDFNNFKLDTVDGILPRKPDSIYVEASKPLDQLSKSPGSSAPYDLVPSAYCTIATKAVLRDLKALLASLSSTTPGARIYILADSETAAKATQLPLQLSLDIRWNICLDKYSNLNRTEMEGLNLWGDFQMMKANAMLYALNAGEPDVMFLDADIFILSPIKLSNYRGQVASLSRHHIMDKKEKTYGRFNGGTFWAATREVVQFWVSRYPYSRYYDQACLEDVGLKFNCHLMHEAQNVSPFRIFEANENPQLLIEQFTIEGGQVLYKGIPLEFIHTHLHLKTGIFGAFNSLMLQLYSNIENKIVGNLLSHFINDGTSPT